MFSLTYFEFFNVFIAGEEVFIEKMYNNNNTSIYTSDQTTTLNGVKF